MTQKSRKNARQYITRFLRGRRTSETRNYVWMILKRLGKQIPEDVKKAIKPADLGYVRVKTLMDELVDFGKIPNQTTFYRLLRDLNAADVIEKKSVPMKSERNRPATFYRIARSFDEPFREMWFIPRKELEERLSAAEYRIEELEVELSLERP